MSGALLPVWIIGGPFLGLLFLSLMYRGGSSTGTSMDLSLHDVDHEELSFGMSHPSTATAYTDTRATPYRTGAEFSRSADVGAIGDLSGHVSPGAISEFSQRVSPGAISRLSGPISPGAISRLSAPVPPGAISRLSGHKSPGAISKLSAAPALGSIPRLSTGWFVSNLFGLPLLTRTQSPLEPDSTLLISKLRDL